jgi:ribosomal protein S18 acetylase RimI-like enzyme
MVTLEWSDWRNGTFWWIQSVYVAKDARGQGVYRALHDAVRQLAHDDGHVCGIRLYVEHDNAGAQETYRKVGMRASHYRMFEEEPVLPASTGSTS